MKKFLLSLAVLCGASSLFAGEIQEVLTVDLFGFTKENAYSDVKWTSDLTGVTYEGNMCKANAANGNGMQFRTTSNKEAGLVATANPKGAVIKNVAVEPSTTASTTNQWNVYGNTAVYSGFKALYDETTAGTIIGSGTTAATVTAEADNLIGFGFRGQKNAIYIQKITITYEIAGMVGKKEANLSFGEKEFTVEFGTEFAAPELTKATTADVEYTSSNEDVATVNEVSGKVEIVGLGTTTITATAVENDEYYGGTASYTIDVVSLVTVEKAAQMSSGEFVFVSGGKYNVLFDSNYGYMSTTDIPAEATETSFRANAAYMLTFLEVDGGYNIATSTGKFLGAKDGFKTFDTTADSEANRVWTVEIAADGFATITNVATGKIVYQDPKYGSFGVYTAEEAADTYLLPTLYKLASGSSIAAVEAEDADAPVEFYNLQGVRVANPENGLFIRRQGSKVEKIVIR